MDGNARFYKYLAAIGEPGGTDSPLSVPSRLRGMIASALQVRGSQQD